MSRFRNFTGQLAARLKRLPGAIWSRPRAATQDQPPTRKEFGESFRFNEDDLAYLAKLGRRLEPIAARPGLAPEEARGIRRVMAALARLPAPTPEINVQIEVTHQMGDPEFRENYSYRVTLDTQHIEIISSGIQSGPAFGSDSFTLESLRWYADGRADHNGNRDTWLERLAFSLERDHTLKVTDTSGGN